jgi:hypothetical protein
MSDYITENEELDDLAAEESDESLVDEDEEYWLNEADRQQAMEEAAIALVNELTGIRLALTDRQQLTDSFGQLNLSVVEQQQQLQTIVSLLEQLTKSLSADNISRLLQVQKSFAIFAQKLDMFEKSTNANIQQQQESRKQAEEIYQNLNRGWRKLEDENKMHRRAIGGVFSPKNFILLSIGVGASAAVFTSLAFKLFILK